MGSQTFHLFPYASTNLQSDYPGSSSFAAAHRRSNISHASSIIRRGRVTVSDENYAHTNLATSLAGRSLPYSPAILATFGWRMGKRMRHLGCILLILFLYQAILFEHELHLACSSSPQSQLTDCKDEACWWYNEKESPPVLAYFPIPSIHMCFSFFSPLHWHACMPFRSPLLSVALCSDCFLPGVSGQQQTSSIWKQGTSKGRPI